jgi:hypothetical protein
VNNQSAEVTKQELKPCDFCANLNPHEGMKRTGLKVKQDTVAYLKPSDWIVLCLDCGACGPNKDSEADAIEAWNTRAAATPTEQARIRAALLTNANIL